jgi:endogenous inhibitor of DNA gyrase (YacG/DUF329 family)
VSRSKNKTRTATRLCASCGEPFTWTSRNPKRRFCDPVCKSRWWRASNNDNTPTPTATAPAAALTTAAPDNASAVTSTASTDGVDTTVTTNAVTQPYDPYVAGYANGQTPSAIQNCPNCHQPVAVINLLVTSAAAYVNTPSRSVTNHS